MAKSKKEQKSQIMKNVWFGDPGDSSGKKEETVMVVIFKVKKLF